MRGTETDCIWKQSDGAHCKQLGMQGNGDLGKGADHLLMCEGIKAVFRNGYTLECLLPKHLFTDLPIHPPTHPLL